MSQRITLAMLRNRIENFNNIDVSRENKLPKLSLETWNPGDGRWYALETENGYRLTTERSAREVWTYMNGLSTGLFDLRKMK